MQLPPGRGPVSSALMRRLRGRGRLDADLVADEVSRRVNVLADDDLQLALAVAYELHYRGFDDADPRAEWSPEVLESRAVIEEAHEAALRAAVSAAPERESVATRLTDLVNADRGLSLSRLMASDPSLDKFRCLVAQRSIYHLKEADPHSWTIPRIGGPAKAALIEIQADEYGGGRYRAMHSTLFSRLMRELGLDDTYGAYWPQATAPTLATVNTMSMFGLHRRLRGASLGHLAVLEMTSSIPNRQYERALRRLDFDAAAAEFYAVHVQADSVHEQVAAFDMCGNFVKDEPAESDAVLFGAAACLLVEGLFAESIARSWKTDEACAALWDASNSVSA